MARIEPGRGSIPVTGSDTLHIQDQLNVLGRINNPSGSLVLSSSDSYTVLSGNLAVVGGGSVSVAGDLQVAGDVTFVSSSNLTIYDPLIILALSQSQIAPQYDSGLIVERGTGENRAFIWKESESRFVAVATDETGSLAGAVAVNGYAPLKIENLNLHSGSVVADESHLILSSSAGSFVHVSGALSLDVDDGVYLDEDRDTRIYGGGLDDRIFFGLGGASNQYEWLTTNATFRRRLQFTTSGTSDRAAIVATDAHLILSSSAGSIVRISGALHTLGSDGDLAVANRVIVMDVDEQIGNDTYSGTYIQFGPQGNHTIAANNEIRFNQGGSDHAIYLADNAGGGALYQPFGHLILSSSVGSTVTISGTLHFPRENKIIVGNTTSDLTINGKSRDVSVGVHVDQGSSDWIEFAAHRHTPIASSGSRMVFARTRGTEDTELPVQEGDHISEWAAVGYDGTDYKIASEIHFAVDGPVEDGVSMPGRIEFYTTPSGSLVSTERLRINEKGQFVAPNSHLILSSSVSGSVVYVSGVLRLPEENNPEFPALQIGSSGSGFYAPGPDQIRVTLGGTSRWLWNANAFQGDKTDAASIRNVVATATNANIHPSRGDTDTGLGWAGEDELTIVAGAVEAVRVTPEHVTVSGNLSSTGHASASLPDPTTVQSGTITFVNDLGFLAVAWDGTWQRIVTGSF